MIYEEIPPRPSLRPYVRRLMHADCCEPLDVTVRPAPTGYSYLGWVYAGEVSATIDGTATDSFRGGLHVAGQIRFQDISVRYQGRLGHVLAEFTATGFYELLPLASCDFVGVAAPVNSARHPWATGFGTLFCRPGAAEARSKLEDCLEALIPQARVVPKYVKDAVDAIEKRGGLISIAVLCSELGVSPRQLLRKFHKIAGVPPKYFARIMQFNAAIAALLQDDDRYLTELSHELGYFDQPHFNHAIKQFLQSSPQAFLVGDRTVEARFLGRVSHARTPDPAGRRGDG